MRRLWLLALLASCGRVGFGVVADAGGNGIAVRVRADDEAPVANAYVLVDGAVVAMTDASGTARLDVAQPTTFHVIYPTTATNWRLFTLVDAPVGASLELGGRAQFGTLDRTMTMELQSRPNAASYTVALPGRCGSETTGAGTTLSFAFRADCEGSVVPAIGSSIDNTGIRAWSELADVPLASGTSFVSQQPFASRSISYTARNLPASAETFELTLGFLHAQGRDLVRASEVPAVLPSGGTAAATISAARPTDAIALVALPPGAFTYRTAESIRVIPGELPASADLDATPMLPFVDTLDVDPDLHHARWTSTVAAEATDLVAWDAWISVAFNTGRNVQWTAYLPAGSTEIAYPVLPPELAAADPLPAGNGAWVGAVVALVDDHDQTGIEVLQTIDQRWRSWSRLSGQFSAGGASLSHRDYITF